MSLETVRAAIVDRLRAVPGIGAIHAHERYAVSQRDFRAFYEEDGKIRGGFLRRVRTSERDATTTYTQEDVTWRIELVHSLEDAAASEIAFDGVIEAARAVFRNDPTLGGAVDTTTVDGRVGLQLEDSGPAMFSGVLCHHARLSLTTRVTIDYAVPTDDFAAAGIGYDGPLTAQDTIHPETA